MRHQIYIYILFFSLSTWFYSCNSEKTNAEKTIFTCNLSFPITSLDPAFASDQPNSWACNQLYNGLIQLNQKLEIVPAIAKHWEISNDRLTYTFFLNTNIFFHDNACFRNGKGRTVVASDFVFSFQRLLNPETAARGSWLFEKIVDTIQPFTAVNDSVFQIHLQKPFAPFLQRLCIQYASVIPHEAIQIYGNDFRSHPVGTGPFIFVKWNEGEILILHKNPHYFERDENGDSLPYLDAVNFQFIPNKSTEFLKFLNGEFDFVSDIDVSLKDNIISKEGNILPAYAKKIKLLKGPYLNTEYLAFLMDTNATVLLNSPATIKNIRQAMNYAFDRNEMLLFLRNSRGIAATGGIVPPSLFSAPLENNYGYSYNIDKALKLLNEAGFENGIGLPPITLHTTDQYQDYAVYIKDKLEEIGIAIEIETVDSRILRQMRIQKETIFFRNSWIADYPDAETYLNLFYGKNGAPPNYCRYQNDSYDSLFEIAVKETDIVQRNLYYRTLDSIMIMDAPIIPLFYDEVYRFVQNNITGLEPDALNMLDLKRVKK